MGASGQAAAHYLDVLAQLVKPIGECKRHGNVVDGTFYAIKLLQRRCAAFLSGRTSGGGFQTL